MIRSLASDGWNYDRLWNGRCDVPDCDAPAPYVALIVDRKRPAHICPTCGELPHDLSDVFRPAVQHVCQEHAQNCLHPGFQALLPQFVIEVYTPAPELTAVAS